MTDQTLQPLTAEEFRLLRELIHAHAGIALAESKTALVNSRLRKRLVLQGLNSFTDYHRLLVAQGPSSEEFVEFVNAITTNKTDFFREPHHFEFVRTKLVPQWEWEAERGRRPRKLRIWHAGCSTGEEPYTLGMTLLEALRAPSSWDIRQLASDIDTRVLATAEQGVYDEEVIRRIPSELRRSYLLRGAGKHDGSYRVRPALRSLVTFRRINLLDSSWPIRSDVRFDAIFCRNVMIYFDKPTQKRLLGRFSRFLKPGGHLFIGHSESLLGVSECYESLGETVYRCLLRADEPEQAA